MSKLLITSGPTRQYLDPVRYLTNASSGRTGAAIAQAALNHGYEVIVVSGPVEIDYPSDAVVVPVVSTEDMLEACMKYLPETEGVIGVAAPCDYRPVTVFKTKMSKKDFTQKDGSGGELELRMIETPDIMASLGKIKEKYPVPDQPDRKRWMVCFALETNDRRVHALQKLQRKCCDLVVLNDSSALHQMTTSVEIIASDGELVASFQGNKLDVAEEIMSTIVYRFY